MIAFLSGKLILEKSGFIIIDVNGIGYKVQTTAKIDDDKKCELFIHEHIREDCDDLYGFKTYEELMLFGKLISVSGVGPKAGLSIMASATSEQIVSAIGSEDVSFFLAVSGIGKKVAAKIIIDLKSKLSDISGSSVFGKMNDSDEVVEALASLGYKRHEVTKHLHSVPAEIKTSEEKIRWILQHSSK